MNKIRPLIIVLGIVLTVVLFWVCLGMGEHPAAGAAAPEGFYGRWIQPWLNPLRMLWALPLIATLVAAVPRRHHKALMLVVGCVISLYAILWSTQEVDLNQFATAFRHFKLVWLIPGFVTFYYSMYLRAVRWGLLFRPQHRFKGWQVFSPIAICFGFNSIMPGRVGEFARAYIVGHRMKAGVATSLATVFAERVLDAVFLLGTLAVSLWILPPLDPNVTQKWGEMTLNAGYVQSALNKLMLLSALMTVMVILLLIPRFQRLMLFVVDRMPLIPRKIKDLMHKLIHQIVRGFNALSDPWTLIQILFHSIVLWILVAVSNIMIAWGFGFSMSLLESMAVVALIGIAIAIPATPGYWGLYEAGAIFSLLVLGILEPDQQSLALAFSLVIHLLQYIPIVAMGLFFAWRSQVKPADVVEEAAETTIEAEQA